MIHIQNIIQTCEACPSQWEGFLTDGRMVYVRYRWGCLSVRVSPEPTRDIMDAVGGEEIFHSALGDGLDGVLSYTQLREATKDVIEWPEECQR